MIARCLGAMLPLAATLAAQGTGMSQRLTLPQLERRAADLRRELVERGAEVEQVTDILLRHHLGLPLGKRAEYDLTDAERTRPPGEVEHDLTESQRKVASLTAELQDKRQQLEQRKTELMATANHEEDTGPRRVRPVSEQPPAPPPQPAVETAPPGSRGVVEFGPEQPAGDPKLVHGTLDHSVLGRALFRAGHYGQARKELAIATKKDPELLDLFMLARCLEKLGDFTRADSTFLQIEGLDTTTKTDGTAVAGSWARAAALARQEMRWNREHSGWHPPKLPTEAEQGP